MIARWLSGSLAATALFVALTHCGSPPGPVTPPTPGPGDGPAPPDGPAHFPLKGFFDLHAHPLSSLGFAGKLIYGGEDFTSGGGGALLPADPQCLKNQRAKSLGQALGHDESTHGSWGLDLDPVDLFDGKFGVTNSCGDAIRSIVITTLQSLYPDTNAPPSNAFGDQGFHDWPKWNDITHQAMYVDWIQRAHQNGLSVMVALAVNNQTLADSVAGPGDGPDDDKASSDLQIAEIKGLAARHADWMEVAYDSASLAKIVSAGKLALVLGLEVDNIGDFNHAPGDVTPTEVKAEIARLYGEGVRYLFPVHLIDNPFGTTAAYQDIFNLSNLREADHFWNLSCAGPHDNVGWRYTLGNPLKQTVDLDPPNMQAVELAGLMVVKLGMLDEAGDDPVVPTCASGVGMVNTPGLSALGKSAVLEMMRQGMMIDVDHMSQASVNDALTLAEAQRYPMNSGHNYVRASGESERQLTAAQYARIGRLHGMAGVGGANAQDTQWLAYYQGIASALGRTDGIGLGTDASGMSPLMPPPSARRFEYSSAFPESSLDGTSWDYNQTGVAHYGMIADFLHGMPALPGGAAAVASLNTGAQYFYDTWRLAEAYRAAHANDASAAPVWHSALGTVNLPAPPVPHWKRGCPEKKERDVWGLCVTKRTATPAVVAASALPAAPLRNPATESTLAPGAYTLVLATGGPLAKERDGFNVGITVEGRRVKVGVVGGAPGTKTPVARGGFRKGRFVMRIDADDQVLVLTANASGPGTLDDVRGGFVAHTAGKTGVPGTFALRMTSKLSRGAKGAKAYPELGAFLAGLHSP